MTDRTHLLRALARSVATPSGLPVTERLCRGAVDLLGAAGAVLTCDPAGPGRYAACATDEVAVRLDEIEELVGDGPGVRAFRSGRSVGAVLGTVSPVGAAGATDAPADGGLPVFTVVAAEVAPVDRPVAVRSWPVRSAGSTVGVLTVHGLPTDPGLGVGHAVPTARSGETAATRATDPVPDGQVLADALAPSLLGTGPLDLLDRRLHRAVGMVVAQTGLPPADAAALLRARAWARGERVADLAVAVLGRGVTFDEEPPATR